MKVAKSTFRQWWQIPRRAGEVMEHRQVSFLELFYDLVYVALIAQLSHNFSHHLDYHGLLKFVILFVIVWWAWLNGTLYHDLHGNNDVKTRVYTFIQMTGVIAMSIFAHDALGENFVGFALSYGFFQLVLSFLWWRTGVHDSDHRPLSVPYVVVFLINTILFVSSAFVERNLGYLMWGIAMLLSLLVPLTGVLAARKNEVAKRQVELITDVGASLVERMGLFTIIVLGEVVVAIVSGASSNHFDINLGIKVLLGILTAVGLWWVYFDFVSHRKPKSGIINFSKWGYLHLPMTIGIVATGSALSNIIHNESSILTNPVQTVFIGAVSLTLICVAFLISSLQKNSETNKAFKNGKHAMLVSAIVLLPFIFFEISGFILIGIAVLLLFFPVVVGFISWLKQI